jgi:hypothetical protein
LDACQRAELAFQRSIGAWWELATVELYVGLTLFWLGDLAEQGRVVDRGMRGSRERGDLFGVVNACTGFCGAAWLGRDDPAGGRREIDAALGQWSRRGFLLAHYWELLGRVQIALYEGDGRGALALLSETWGALSRSLLLRVQLIGTEAYFLRGRAVLAAALETEKSSDRRRAAKDARKDAKRIESESMPYAVGLALLLHAGADALTGDRAEAASRYAAAADRFAEADMGLFLAAARRRHGEMVGGDAGHAEMAEADAWMNAHGVVRPDRMTAMLAPGVANPSK